MNIKRKEIFGLLILLFALLCFISIIFYDPSLQPGGIDRIDAKENFLGYFGIYLSYYYFFVLGYYSLLIQIIIMVIGYCLFTNSPLKKYYNFIINMFFLSVWLSTLTAYFGKDYAGLIGISYNTFLNDIFGSLGSGLILLVSIILIISLFFQISIYNFLKKSIVFFISKLKGIYNKLFNSYSDYLNNKKNKIIIKKEESFNSDVESDSLEDNVSEEENIQELSDSDVETENNLKEDSTIETNTLEEESNSLVDDEIENDDTSDVLIEDEEDIKQGDLDKDKKRKTKYFDYKLPELAYLSDPIEIKSHSEDMLKEKAEQLSYALNSFGVSGNIVKISPGPVITLFEIEPSEGVRVNKFTNLSEDLSRIMGGQRVRIIAPIPGSKTVGVELPNNNPSIVYLKSIINSKKYIDNQSKLKIALGKTTTGDAFILELNKMPHLLVAGATGSGKSVCINTIIISILYNAKPDEVKFILMDPKKVELSTYKSLVGYHLITAPNIDEYVMTTAENSVSILNSAIIEMERRFQLFSDNRVRNIQEYNKKRISDDSLEKIPYLVIIIDELADLMMTSGRSIEEPITRLAQKARAVGLHLIVATQRPSVDVITGIIKANFPARISFQVSSRVDSRTIIDQIGAEKLLGRGDMLFLQPGTASPIRIHNAFITLDEIESILDHISKQSKQSKQDEIKLPEVKKKETANNFNISEEQDEYLKEAAKLVIDHQQASVSLLQRKFRIGYSRAGRLIDELESLGIISGYSGSKAREVLVEHSYLNEVFDD